MELPRSDDASYVLDVKDDPSAPPSSDSSAPAAFSSTPEQAASFKQKESELMAPPNNVMPSSRDDNKYASDADAKSASEPGAHDQRLSLPPSGDPIIVVNNVHKTYLLGVEGVAALRGVSVTISRGEFIVILGKSGGGKTSLLNLIGTIDKPTKGDITICGKRLTARSTDAEIAYLRLKKIGFVFQTFNLISSMMAVENVELPMVLDGSLSAGAMRERAKELLSSVGMGKRTDHVPSQLSGGEQQRVTIARAIANEPDILLLDEPTGDLDTHNGHIVLNLLLELNRKHKKTLVMVTHDVSLRLYAHRVIHMLDGKIQRIEEIPPEVRRQTEDELRNAIEKGDALRSKGAEFVKETRDPEAFYKFLKFQSK